MSTPPDRSLLDRIDRLERSIAELARELEDVRAATMRGAAQPLSRNVVQAPPRDAAEEGAPRFIRDMGRTARGVAPEPAVGPQPSVDASATRNPQSATAPHRSHWTADEVEGLVGRYGMLGLATLTGLAAVGTFLGWAITQGLLGPSVRVGLGLVLAAGLAATGAWLRPRERSFGAALLGIALAIVHVCGWAASPAKLGLVSAWTALALTVAASAALAAFAHREDDEPLWCAGFGGAAVAPFVTGGDSENALLLTLYGIAVLLAGSWALAHRPWRIAGRVLGASATLFTFAILASPHRTGSPLMALGLACTVAALGVMPFAAPAARRARLRLFGLLAAIAALTSSETYAMKVEPLLVIAAIAGAAALWLAMLDRSAKDPAGALPEGIAGEGAMLLDWVDAAVIPLGFLAAALLTVDGPPLEDAATALAGAAMIGAFVHRRRRSALRDAGVFALSAALLTAAWDGAATVPDWRIAVVAAVAVALVAAERWRSAGPWYPVAAITLITCSMSVFADLFDRAAYRYTPFLTQPSALAAIVAASWFAFMRLAAAGRSHWSGPDVKPFIAVAAWTWTFLWIHQELYEAFSPTASTLLLISYYAATSVIAVWEGRRRRMPAVRHVGLGLALVAAAAAARGAAHLDAVWARIAGYLVTSGFLLALAWWYRRRPDGTSASPVG